MAHRFAQLTKTLTAVISLSIGHAATAAPAVSTSWGVLSTARADDLWPDTMTGLLNQLGAFLMEMRTSELTDKIAAIQALYHADGIPASADRLEGLVLVATTYKLLKADPGYLPADLAKAFADDLRNMYRDLGGIPWLLG